MQSQALPILDFDPSPTAIIEPSHIIKQRASNHKVLMCFFQDVLTDLEKEGLAIRVDKLNSEIGENPIYQMELRGQSFLVIHPGVGAPLGAAYMEEMIARGCSQFIACGGCGVLKQEIAMGHILLPETAVRDEGTSYSYIQPAAEIHANKDVIASILETLKRMDEKYDLVKTWTTDAVYRETVERVRIRVGQGCSVVEMETAAFMAVAQFRGVQFGQLLYGGDSVHETGWDQRKWDKHGGVRQGLFWLAVEALLDLPE